MIEKLSGNLLEKLEIQQKRCCNKDADLTSSSMVLLVQGFALRTAVIQEVTRNKNHAKCTKFTPQPLWACFFFFNRKIPVLVIFRQYQQQMRDGVGVMMSVVAVKPVNSYYLSFPLISLSLSTALGSIFPSNHFLAVREQLYFEYQIYIKKPAMFSILSIQHASRKQLFSHCF